MSAPNPIPNLHQSHHDRLSLRDKLRSAASSKAKDPSPSSSSPQQSPSLPSNLDRLSHLLSTPQPHSHLGLQLDHSNHIPSPDSLDRLLSAPYWPLGPSFLRLLQPVQPSCTEETAKQDEDLFSQADLDGSPITDDSASASTMDDLARAERLALESAGTALMGHSPFYRRPFAPYPDKPVQPRPAYHWTAQERHPDAREPGSAHNRGARFSLPGTESQLTLVPGLSHSAPHQPREVARGPTDSHAHKRAASVAWHPSSKRHRTTKWPASSEAASYSYSPPPQTSTRFRSDVLEARSTEPRPRRAPSPSRADRWEIGRSPGPAEESYGSPMHKGPSRLSSQHAAHVHVDRGGLLRLKDSAPGDTPWVHHPPEAPRRMREVDNGWGSRAGAQKRLASGHGASTTERNHAGAVRSRGPHGHGLSVRGASASPTVDTHLSEEEDEAYYTLGPLKSLVIEALPHAVHSWVNRPIVEAICLLGQWLETRKVWGPGQWGALRTDHIAGVVDGVCEYSVKHIMTCCKATRFEELLSVPSKTGILDVFCDHNERSYVRLHKDFTPTGLLFRPIIKSIRRHTVETQLTSLEAGSLMRSYVMKNFKDDELGCLFKPDRGPMECLARAARAGVVEMNGVRSGMVAVGEDALESRMVKLAKEWAFPKDRKGRESDSGLDRRQYGAERDRGISKTVDELVEMVVRNLHRRYHAPRAPRECEVKEPRRRPVGDETGLERRGATGSEQHRGPARGGSFEKPIRFGRQDEQQQTGTSIKKDDGGGKGHGNGMVVQGIENQISSSHPDVSGVSANGQMIGGGSSNVGGADSAMTSSKMGGADSAIMSSLQNLIDEVFKNKAPGSGTDPTNGNNNKNQVTTTTTTPQV